MTPMHYAAAAKNIAFIELAVEDLSKLDKNKGLAIINIQDKSGQATFLSYLLQTKFNVKQSIQLKVLKLLKLKFGNISKLSLSY